jgi:hypothetical protein
VSDPRATLGFRRLRETIAEQIVPVAAASASWIGARALLLEPTPSRPLASVELLLLLAAVAASFAWVTARQLTILNLRRPIVHAAWGTGAAVVALVTLAFAVSRGFDSACADLGGAVERVADTTLPSSVHVGHLVCRIRPVPDNVYLPGTLLRAPWDGFVAPWQVVVLLGWSAASAIGLRNLRIGPTRLGLALAEELQTTPAAGWKAVVGASGPTALQACGNPTLWGEPCAQLYAADAPIEPGAWCIRCAQTYRKAERSVSFSVVSLFTGDIDVLNGLERLDATAWSPDRAQPPDARLSGQERWVRLGRTEVPDVITVSTLLALVLDQLKPWSKEASADQQEAFALAERRASRLACWIWIGHEEDQLTYARPSTRAVLAVGSTRLKDLPIEAGDRLALQLDIGLLPLELRTGYRQTFLDAGRPPLVQNLKQDVWVPTAPPQGMPDGRWLPRVGGDALRAWLSLDRLRPDAALGVVSPRPYVLPGMAAEDRPVPEGRLDLVRMPLVEQTPVPDPMPGRSLTEWDWFEEAHLELLRQQALVLVLA